MKISTLIILGALLLSACSEKEKSPELPVVTTLNATDVTSDVAVLSGEVISMTDLVTARGFCWSSLPEPDLDDSVIYCNSGISKYSDTLTGLSPSKSYFYRAFATNSVGTAFGAEKSFTTTERIPLSGRFVSNTPCNNTRDQSEVLVDDTLSCAEYSYDASTHILNIIHFNAVFNCCVDNIICEISLSNDTIYIKEVELEGLCNCLCKYDLTIEIEGVYAQSYIVKFIEPYLWMNPPLIFPIDLATTVSGTECVTRLNLPWGWFGL